MITIAPSILAADFSNLEKQIRHLEAGGADWLHLDVMDGHFVPNISFGPPVIRSIRKMTRLPFDVHLMIEDPDRYLDSFREAGADRMTVHVEACRHLNRTIARIKDLGSKAGVCVNPATPVESLCDVVTAADLILIMSVNPGFGGQEFIPQTIAKLRRATELITDSGSSALLEVDGGIDERTAPLVVSAGANVLVAGNYIFSSPDIPSAIAKLRRSVSLNIS